MNRSELERLILNRCEGTEWHLSLWYPRVSREVIGVPRGIPDAEVQRTLFQLIETGRIEMGSVEGADFAPRPAEIPIGCCPDLYIRTAALDSIVSASR